MCMQHPLCFLNLPFSFAINLRLHKYPEPTARERSTGFGLQTAAVAVGGGSPIVSNVEEYDGSSWTNATAYPTVINHASSAGILTAGLVFGGSIPPTTTGTKLYDGTNWTATGALSTARQAAAGFGTAAVAASKAAVFAAPTTAGLGAAPQTTGGGWGDGQGSSVRAATIAGSSEAAVPKSVECGAEDGTYIGGRWRVEGSS